MIYVTETNFERQLALLDTVSQQRGKHHAVAWLYPDSKANTVAGLTVGEHLGLLPVTTYSDGSEKGLNTKPKEFNAGLLSELLKNQTEVIEFCDSLAIYQPDEKEWSACLIHHEGMCLVKDDSLLEKLKEQKFAVSTEAPSWW